MKKLNQIISGFSHQLVGEGLDSTLDSIVFDSRKASANNLFVAVRGTLTDGHHYIEQAISNGCKMICCEALPDGVYDEVVFIKVDNTKLALGAHGCCFL